ncbi:MAG: class I SAM-dependent methyltransferase [Bacteroidota bacterium]
MDKVKAQGSYEGWNDIWDAQSKQGELNPMYTESTPQTIYQFWQNAYANDLLSLIGEKNYSSFRELGAGRGTTSMYLSKNGYHDVTMVDLAEEGFKVATYSFKYFNLPKPKMLLANVEQTGLEEEFFDCIYNIGLLEHFENPAPTLVENYRLLKKDGLIFMPIVPALPFSKSLLARIFFNPISIVKHLVKTLLGKTKKSASSSILRTTHDREYYVKICEEIGFKEVQCIPYNPYWKVNPDGNFLDKVTLPIYRWHYKTFRQGKQLSLRCSAAAELCCLMLATK